MGIQLPQTGVDYPFTKRRPLFIKDAPGFEPTAGHINRGGLGQRFLGKEKQMTMMSHAAKITEPLPRCVYACTYTGPGAVPLIS